MASQAALAAVTGMPAVLIASSAKAACAGRHSYTKARWDTATAEDLEPFVGDRFRVRIKGYGGIVMRLVAAYPALIPRCRDNDPFHQVLRFSGKARRDACPIPRIARRTAASRTNRFDP